MVSPELQIYKCFACGEGGDVFTFLEKYETMDFAEALKYLADKAHITLTSFNSDENSEKQKLYEINTLAAKFYNFLLTSHPIGKVALTYLLATRSITLDSITTFNIGYAPHNKNSLSDFLINKKKFTVKDIEAAGLIFVSKRNIYDRFAGRIIFPISDHRGNTIALAGRLLPPEKKNVGKYINSPETAIYHKSNSLYGINITKDAIKQAGFAVVVEGEVDLLTSYQTGIQNVVAIKGSAFTDGQGRLLSRYTNDIVLALDSDFAGVNAGIRGIKLLDDLGFDIRVAKLGKYKDPDDAGRANPEFLKTAITASIPVWDFIIDESLSRFDKTTASGKAKIGKFLTPILAQISNKIVQDHYIKKLAHLLEVDTSAVSGEVAKVVIPETKTKVEPLKHQDAKKSRRELLEESLLGLILKEDPSLLQKPQVSSLIKTPFAQRILTEFMSFAKTKPKLNLETFAKYLPKELLDNFAKIIFSLGQIDESSVKNEINQTFKQLSVMTTRQELIALTKSDSKSSTTLAILAKKLKDFNSDTFERIIDS